MHGKMPSGKRLSGTRPWLNLPAKDKMKAAPASHGISEDGIPKIGIDGGILRLDIGSQKDTIRRKRLTEC